MKSKVKKKNAEEQMTRKKIVVNLGFFFSELEHKLQASLQQYSENTNSGHRSRNEKSKVEIDPATGEPMDEEWDGASYAERSIANKNKRKRVEQSVISERIGKS